MKLRHFLHNRKRFDDFAPIQKAPPNQKVIWFHCASLGEFELCKPLIKIIKSTYPKVHLFLSFFSPSGTQISSDFNLIDSVGFLPFDTKRNVRSFLDKINPDVAIFVKYEFWPNVLNELHRRKIRTFAISTRFYQNHFLFRWYGHWLLQKLKTMNHLFVQNQESFDLLKQHQFHNISICGDLRIDRVIEKASQPFHHEILDAFLNNQTCFVAGSTWEKDIELLFPEIESLFDKIIIAPHDVGLKSIAFIESKISSTYQKMSQSEIKTIQKTQTLIVDSIGILSSIYQYAQVTYVGGGFSKKGLHNILEPMGYFKPVLFGPHYQYFPEAVDLIHKHIAFSIADKHMLQQTLKELKENPQKLAHIEKEVQRYFDKNKNGTQKVFRKICKYF